MNGQIRAVVLAAGKGTRMKSKRPKVLHEVCGRPLLWYVLRALRDAGVADVTVVASAELAEHVPGVAETAHRAPVRVVLQEPQLGTGHALQIALAALEVRTGTLVVLNGDMPLVEAALVRATIDRRSGPLALVTARMPLPCAFGRVVRSGAHVARVVEARDATSDELLLDEMNAGLYAYDETAVRVAAASLRNDNAQGEYYLTDTIAHLACSAESIAAVVADDYRSVLGVNDRAELAAAAALLNRRLCEQHLRAGVTIVDPATTYLEPDLQIAADVTILPNTTLAGATSIGAHAEIGPNSRLSNATIGEHVVVTESVVIDTNVGDFAIVGPFAHLRDGTEIGTGGRIGNFVEIKASTLSPGVKASHLTYLGDAAIGARTNIGAGTITANYDGKKKHRTRIGKDVRIGSNSTIIAPVHIGDDALTGGGSVVLSDVPDGGRVAGNPARPLPEKSR